MSRGGLLKHLRGSDLSERVYVGVRVLELKGYTNKVACLEVAKALDWKWRLAKSKRGRPSVGKPLMTLWRKHRQLDPPGPKGGTLAMALQHALLWLTPLLAKVWPVLVDVSIKAAILLAAAGAGTLAMRRASAVQRHLVWLLAISGALALPLFSVLLPAWRILPRWPGQNAVETAESPQSEWPQIGSKPATAPQPIADRPRMEPMPISEAYRQEPIPSAAASSAVEPTMPPPALPAWWTRVAWQQGLVAAWILGTAALMFRYCLGMVFLRRTGRAAQPVEDPRWRTLLAETARAMLVRRSVLLRESPRCTIPMTWGTRRPVILLPTGASAWPAERRHVVLAHELAHVKRCDCLTQLLAQVARALYWFNPLVWLAWRRLLAESERACDDRVLTLGSKVSDHAEHSSKVAAGSRGDMRLASAAIAMARPSQLYARLQAILDEKRNRRRLTRLAVAAALLTVTAIVISLSALKAVEESRIETDSMPTNRRRRRHCSSPSRTHPPLPGLPPRPNGQTISGGSIGVCIP